MAATCFSNNSSSCCLACGAIFSSAETFVFFNAQQTVSLHSSAPMRIGREASSAERGPGRTSRTPANQPAVAASSANILVRPLRAKRWRWARVEGASEFGELYGVGGLGFRNAPGATKRERRIAAWQQRSERVARGGGGEDDAAATRQYNEYQDRTSVLVRRADKQAWDRTRAARRSGLQSTRAVATSAPLLTPPGAPALEDALATLEGALLQRATRARNARAQTMGMTKGRGL